MSPVDAFLLASANPDKRREIAAILGEAGLAVELPPAMPEVEETGSTLEENARLKAEALVAATGRAVLADDTGLEVDALGGAPGVRAARYAGEGATYADNVAKLVTALAGVPRERRSARFATVALALYPDGRELVVRGAVEGWIATAPRGGAGFGYDPVFVPAEGDGRTFAEMEAGEKHLLSHRGRAFRALAERLLAPAREAFPMAERVTGEVGSETLREARRQRRGVRSRMAEVETALAAPASTPAGWWGGMIGPLAALQEAFDRHVEVTERRDGLFAEIIEDSPRLAHACYELQQEHLVIAQALAGLLAPRASGDAGTEAARQDVEEMLGLLRQHRHRGANLLFEAYSVDVSTGD